MNHTTRLLALRLPAFALMAGLGACTMGPSYRAPNPQMPASWNQVPAVSSIGTVASDPDPLWWRSFNDPVLTRLIAQAVSGNIDLRRATLRIVQARQQEAAARAAGLPTLGSSASYQRNQLGARGLIESKIDNPSITNSQLGRQAIDAVSQPVDLFQYGFDASWEVDIFGNVRRSVEQARAQTQAQAEATRDSLVSLEAEVAQTYAQLRGAEALARMGEENRKTAQGLLDLTTRQRARGLTTELDVENARAQLATIDSTLPQYERMTVQARNRLAVLTGQPPGALDQELATAAPIPPVPPDVPVGLPSTLARRRPDIREAEANLHAATAGVGVALTQFFPDVSLTGNFGLRALNASYLTDWASHFYSFGPSVSLPIFQGGKLRANLRLAKAQQQDAALAYQSTVLNALRDVEDSLVAYRTDQSQYASLQQSVRANETALTLARSRYTSGLSNYLDVLDAQRSLVQARQQSIQAQLTVTTDLIAVYKALGGGWQESSPVGAAGPQDPTLAAPTGATQPLSDVGAMPDNHPLVKSPLPAPAATPDGIIAPAAQ